jgi:hypothetical protein
MEVLADTYPRLAPQENDNASQIDVELKVAELYEEVISFTRLAIKYYQRSGFSTFSYSLSLRLCKGRNS